MRHVLLVLVIAAACDKSKDSGSVANAWTHEVTGTVSIDGKPIVITECKVEKRMDTRISLMFDGGHLSFEAGRLSLYQGDDDKSAMMRGQQLSCSEIRGERSHGTSSDAPGWARGKLAAQCTAPVPVNVDLDLTCGPLPPDAQAEIDKMKVEMQQLGSAANVTGSAGSAN